MVSWWIVIILCMLSGSAGCLMMAIFAAGKVAEPYQVVLKPYHIKGEYRQERRQQWRRIWRDRG